MLFSAPDTSVPKWLFFSLKGSMVFPCSGVKKGRMEGVLPVADDSVREEKDGLLFWFFLLANLLIFEGFTWYWSAFSTSSLSIESAF